MIIIIIIIIGNLERRERRWESLRERRCLWYRMYTSFCSISEKESLADGKRKEKKEEEEEEEGEEEEEERSDKDDRQL